MRVGGAGEPCDAYNRPYYRPGADVTRSQMAKFIDNARHLPSIRIEGSSPSSLIFANNDAGDGVAGHSHRPTFGNGVSGSSSSTSGGKGVYGNSDCAGCRGVDGQSWSGWGVHGWSNTGQAGHFNGDVQVTGSLSKASGSFQIDHPLDPANKYLYHSFVESPDMMNVYNGNITLDAEGEAWVQMPEWFDALNRDFRYQLTPIGAPGPNLYVAQEMKDDRFKIAGGQAGAKVSWQVTGIRQDRYAEAHRIPIEEDKPADEQGKYLHPTEWGQLEELGIDYEP